MRELEKRVGTEMSNNKKIALQVHILSLIHIWGTTIVSDWLKIRITSDPGHSFLDKMIALVEGASRKKTPNEIALNTLLVSLTIIFLIVIVTLYPIGVYIGVELPASTLIALTVCLIPTTIGGLLSAIGIAGMDRVTRFNVIAMSGKAVEACGDVDTMILDKTCLLYTSRCV